MKKQPWFKFCPQDWMADPHLRLLDMRAHGLLINCMAIAHNGNPYGHLSNGGIPLTPLDVGKMYGWSPRSVQAATDRLLISGRLAKDSAGRWSVPRMVKDGEYFARQSEFGSLGGGNPALRTAAKRIVVPPKAPRRAVLPPVVTPPVVKAPPETPPTPPPPAAPAVPIAQPTPSPVVASKTTTKTHTVVLQPLKYSSEFEDWFQTYPARGRKGKIAVYKAWQKARKTVDVETLTAGVTRLADAIKRGFVNPEYVKHAATWLNSGCWEDEYGQAGRPETERERERQRELNEKGFVIDR